MLHDKIGMTISNIDTNKTQKKIKSHLNMIIASLGLFYGI